MFTARAVAAASGSSVKSVLVIDETGAVPLRDTLADGSLAVTVCAPAQAVDSIRAVAAEAVVVAGMGETSPRFVSHLRQNLQTNCPGIIVALNQRNDGVRDQCLIAGAADVSPEGQPEDIAARADSLLNGWLRGAPRKPFKAAIRGQRTRQTLTLPAADLDPTGFAFASEVDVPAGELVRVALPLPSLQLIVWGRVAELEGERGVRFLALATEERVRLVSTLRGMPDALAAVPISRPSAQAIPVMSRSASMPALPIEPANRAGELPSAARGVSVPPAANPAAAAPQQPVAVRSGPSSPIAQTEPASAAQASPSSQPASVVPSLPAPEAAQPTELSPEHPEKSVAPGTAGASAQGIDDLIGSVLSETGSAGQPGASAPPVNGESPAATWPSVKFTEEASTAALREALSVGLVGAVDGAPSGEVVLAFTRTLSIPEQHVFDAEPPAGLPDPAIVLRALVLRLRFFSYSRSAQEALSGSHGPWIVDGEVTAVLQADFDAIDAELQKATSAYFASGDTPRIKELNQFRQTMLRAENDFRITIARLKGEAIVSSGGSAMLLDQDAGAPASGAFTAVRRESQKGAPAEKKPEANPYKKAARKGAPSRQMGLFVICGLLIAATLAYALYERNNQLRVMDPSEYAELGAVQVNFNNGEHKASIIVPEGWTIDPHQAKLNEFLTSHNVQTYVVESTKHALLAFGSPGRPQYRTKAAAGAANPAGQPHPGAPGAQAAAPTAGVPK